MKTLNNYTFFWKAKIAQWTYSPFKDSYGVEYHCAEQYMMALKSLLFDDIETYRLIMNEKSPKEIQKLGRLIKKFNEDIWIEHRESIVIEANMLKFSQNKDLLNILLSTNDTILVEASPYDCIWGVGLSLDDELILDEKNWRGLNLLGKCLMIVREQLS